ncbi:antitoxin [Ilumatobacter nonamiensis]|uniref:antitoxin n=1 Tax=Ilumatobacter nonamiensis TaxID=467093 RepID=UPI0003457379|nr:antitoxin [Ilumatobacter nonamiensis]
MGILNTRNLRKAKALLEKNRHKVGDVVEKAGGTLDKVSKGKTSSVTAKASDAAQKYSQGASPKYSTEFDVDHETRQTMNAQDSAEAKIRQSQATETAANAVKGAADALTNLMNKATETAEKGKAQDRTKQQ